MDLIHNFLSSFSLRQNCRPGANVRKALILFPDGRKSLTSLGGFLWNRCPTTHCCILFASKSLLQSSACPQTPASPTDDVIVPKELAPSSSSCNASSGTLYYFCSQQCCWLGCRILAAILGTWDSYSWSRLHHKIRKQKRTRVRTELIFLNEALAKCSWLIYIFLSFCQILMPSSDPFK